MKLPLYVIHDKTVLRKSGDHIIVEEYRHKPGNKPYKTTPCPVEGISYIVLFGNCRMSMWLLDFVAGKGIIVIKFSYGGKLEWILYPPENNIGKGRLLQYSAYLLDNGKKRLMLAKEFIRSSALNKESLLKQYGIRTDFITKQLVSLDKAPDIETSRGYEGTIGNYYLKCLQKVIKHFSFAGREYNPPKDPVNALLSFSYAMLYADIVSKVYEHCLDPFLGYLHEQNNGNLSLVYDISEVFKQDVDKFVINLINKKIIKKFHFNKKGDIYVLDTAGKDVFLKQWFAFLRNTQSRGLKKSSTSEIIRKEVIKLKNYLEEGIRYEGHRI